jgi:hypothetical protein
VPWLISGAVGAVAEELVGVGDDEPSDVRGGAAGSVSWGDRRLVADGRSAVLS